MTPDPSTSSEGTHKYPNPPLHPKRSGVCPLQPSKVFYENSHRSPPSLALPLDSEGLQLRLPILQFPVPSSQLQLRHLPVDIKIKPKASISIYAPPTPLLARYPSSPSLCRTAPLAHPHTSNSDQCCDRAASDRWPATGRLPCCVSTRVVTLDGGECVCVCVCVCVSVCVYLPKDEKRGNRKLQRTAPVSHEAHPTYRVALVVRREVAVARLVDGRGVVLEPVDVGGEGGVPEHAAVTLVHEDAEGEVPVGDRVRVGAGGRVVGVGANGGVGDGAGAVVVLLDGRVGEGFARGVL